VNVKIKIGNVGGSISWNIQVALKEFPGNNLKDGPINIPYLAPGKNVTVIFNWTPSEESQQLVISAYYVDQQLGTIHPSTKSMDLDVHGPEKLRYPDSIYYISLAFLILVAVILAVVVRRMGRKGGRSDEP
jgi:hypothetical protein